ncbi:class II aldolase/adducin family protein [Paraburkholderia sediminicola]|uniref:class II aldolase/adducin family protein n=1 Tax=Paraburkholderia sediminicola TaxID=458836 RepID=UPI0038BAC0CC
MSVSPIATMDELPLARQSSSDVDEAERELRVELAAAYRLVDYFGWTEQIYGHLSARIPGPENHFLINAFGENYDEVKASSLVKIDVDGKVVSGANSAVNCAGFVIHSAIHMMHEERNLVVMHIHSRAGMAIAAIKEGLLPISMFSTVFYENIGYHDYEGASLYLDERERIVRSLGSAKALILRNHGLLVTGASVPECFLRLYRLERACQIQVDAAACGTPNLIGAPVATRSRNDLGEFQGMQHVPEGTIEFAALRRKLDRIDPGYRD